jgi:hypothetical protein
MKDGLNFCKKGVRSDICFSLMLTPGKKLKDFIVYEYVLDKNLFWFHQIHLQLAETTPAKSGLKQKEPEIRKMRLKDSFDSPRWWHL